MANAVMMLRTLGYADDHPHMVTARAAVEKLMTERGDDLYFQPCLSPVWDTALAAHALLESGPREDARLTQALDWLAERQVLDHVGDWAVRRPGLRPGGWAFQYANPDYPDVDDTAVVALAMHRADARRYAENVDRACEWIEGMQSKSGGWGAFDPENEHYYLNSIPFADHGALLDPPTVDVTARCIGCLAQVDAGRYAGADPPRHRLHPPRAGGGRLVVRPLGRELRLRHLVGAGGAEGRGRGHARSPTSAAPSTGWWRTSTRMAAGARGWRATRARVDGFGCPSVPSQTAWALLGLMSAGEAESEAVRRGVAWLEAAPREGARWRRSSSRGPASRACST